MSEEHTSNGRPRSISLWRVFAMASAMTSGCLLFACETCPEHGLSPRYTFTDILTFGTTHPSPYSVEDGEIEASPEEMVITYRSPDGSLWRATYVAAAK